MKTTLKVIFLICFSILLSTKSFTQIVFKQNDSILVIKNSDTLDLAWAGGINFGQLSKVDLDLDGKEDIIVFDRADYRVACFLNVGGPGEIKYRHAPQYENLFPNSTGWMLMRDFNLDGKKDVFYCKSGGVMSVHKNTSTTSLKFDLYDNSVISDQYPGGLIGIYIPSTDIPSISDIDHDGDLDVLSFGVFGTYLEYHKNYSVENYGNHDTLDYVLKNNCWGHFSETGVNTNKLNLFDTCLWNVPNPEGLGNGGGERHSGSTVLAFDNNGDSVADLLLGDVSFNNIVMGLNGGTAPNQNSSLISQDTAFPAYDTSVDITLFPGVFLEDVNNDGIKDMVLSPNTAELSENNNSMWYYRNEGTNSIPNFRFEKKSLLQDEMIEMGSNSIPELFDYNGDGLLDLIISNYGYFNRDSITYDCRLKLYRNIGTAINPVFEFVTDDYQNISALKLGNSLHPAFADLDNDGDQDMILGNSEGYLHYFTNLAGAGSTAIFSMTTDRVQSNTGDTIDVGQFSAPQLFDYDMDGDFDLIIGKINGGIRYYENIGTTSAYSFKKITDTLGRVEIHEFWDIYGASTGFCTPRFYRNGPKVSLYCGSQQGGIYKFTGINPANPFQTFIIDTTIYQTDIGRRSVPVLHDFKNDGKMDLIVGNEKGGLLFYTEGFKDSTINNRGFIKDTACRSYTSPSGKIYNSSGLYLDTINTTTITDSIVNIEILIISNDTSVSLIYPYYKATSPFATYQWLDCTNGHAIIPGATGQWFTIPQNGSYAVELTRFGCKDTSSCHTINNVSVTEKKNELSFSIFPNPADEVLNIKISNSESFKNDITIYNYLGEVIETKSVSSSLTQLNVSAYSKGVYLITIENTEGRKTQRFVVQ